MKTCAGLQLNQRNPRHAAEHRAGDNRHLIRAHDVWQIEIIAQVFAR